MEEKKQKHVVTFAATQDEMKKIELIRRENKRKTYTDTIRVLVENEYEKILKKNIGVAIQ